MAIHKVPGCDSDHDPEALTARAAMDALLAHSHAVGEVESVRLRDAAGRVLAESPNSPMDVPGHTNSAMDGYAVHGDDIPADGETALRLAGKSLAGEPYAGEVKPGECVRIMTGAEMPGGCDTVVMQEHVRDEGERIVIDHENKRGQNVRAAGEDIAKGSRVLTRGRALSAADVGLLASIGLTEARVFRKPRVAFFSTGKEIVAAGEPLKNAQLYDSNRHTLDAMLAELAVERADYGIVDDSRDAMRDTLARAAGECDLVLSTGGASVGETDFVVELAAELGELHFRKIAVKPGRPLTFATLGKASYLALPGNPVSVMVMFYYFVKPLVAHIAGGQYEPPPRFTAVCADRLKKRRGRMELQRGVLRADGDACTVKKTGAQGSGILRSMSQANCLIVLDEDCEGVEPGATVTVIPLYALA